MSGRARVRDPCARLEESIPWFLAVSASPVCLSEARQPVRYRRRRFIGGEQDGMEFSSVSHDDAGARHVTSPTRSNAAELQAHAGAPHAPPVDGARLDEQATPRRMPEAPFPPSKQAARPLPLRRPAAATPSLPRTAGIKKYASDAAPVDGACRDDSTDSGRMPETMQQPTTH